MNVSHFSGYLVNDPELYPVKDTKVVRFRLAIPGRRFKRANGEVVQERAFTECQAWDTGAEIIHKHFRRGDPIIIHASLRTENWTDKEGKHHSKNVYRVDEFEFVPRNSRDKLQDSEQKSEKKEEELEEIPF